MGVWLIVLYEQADLAVLFILLKLGLTDIWSQPVNI